MATQLTKSVIGKDDVQYNTTEQYPAETFTRIGQLATTTLTKFPDIYKTHFSIINACYWNSAAKNDTTITQALSYIGANNRSLYIEPGDWTISGDLTIPSNVELVIGHKATLTVASGKTLTINGPIVAPPVRVFAGDGTTTINSTGALWKNTWTGATNDCLYLQNQGLAAEINTFTAADTTPSVADGLIFKTANAAPTTITSFDDGITGQVIYIIVNDANTTFDFSSGNIQGYSTSTWTASSGNSMVAKYDGTNWHCIGPDNASSTLTTQGDMLYASAASVLGRLAIGTANFKLFTNAGGTAPEWASGLYVGNFARLTNAATGDVSYTGTGFKPSVLIFMISYNAGSEGQAWSVGADDGTRRGCIYHTITSDSHSTITTASGYLTISSGKVQSCLVKSFDSNGFTLTWTNTGSPAEYTINATYLAIR